MALPPLVHLALSKQMHVMSGGGVPPALPTRNASGGDEFALD